MSKLINKIKVFLTSLTHNKNKTAQYTKLEERITRLEKANIVMLKRLIQFDEKFAESSKNKVRLVRASTTESVKDGKQDKTTYH